MKKIFLLNFILFLTFFYTNIFCNDNKIEILANTVGVITEKDYNEKIDVIKNIESSNNKSSNIENDILDLSPNFVASENIIKTDKKNNEDFKAKQENKISLEILADSKENESDSGLMIVYDFWIDENFLINSYNVSYLALEKSLLENYNSLKFIYDNAKNFYIVLGVQTPLLDFIILEKELIKNQYITNNKNIIKNSQIIDNLIMQKLSIEDKKYILNKIKIFPKNVDEKLSKNNKILDFYNNLKILDIDYSILNSTETASIEPYIQGLKIDNQFFLEALVFYNILWLDEESLNNERIEKILIDPNYKLTKEDLKFIKILKNNKIEEAVNFFVNIPEKWSYIVYPYYNPKIDILASNTLPNYFGNYLKTNINIINDAAWQIAKSFKSINNFYLNTAKKYQNHKFSSGIITNLDYIDKNILKILSVRNYEFVLNKGDYFYEYEPVVLNGFGTNPGKNICLFFENIDFYSDGNMENIIKNFIKEVVTFRTKNLDAILILNKDKLKNKGVSFEQYKTFYDLLFSELIKNKNINFISIENFKNKIIDSVKLKKTAGNEKILDDKSLFKNRFKRVNLDEQEFMMNADYMVKYLKKDTLENYWFIIKLLKRELEIKKNKKEIDMNVYLENINNIYRLESIYFLELISSNDQKEKFSYNNLKMEMKKILYNTAQIIDIDVEDLKNINLNQNFKNSKNIKVEEFSQIFYYKENKGFRLEDSLNDDYGDGNYIYPTKKHLKKGSLDLKALSVINSLNILMFRIEMRNFNQKDLDILKNKQIDIYIDTNSKIGAGNTNLLPMRNAFTEPINAWEYAVSINQDGAFLYITDINGNIKKIKDLDVKLDYENNFLIVYIPKIILDGDIYSWKYIILSCGYDELSKSIIKVDSQVSENNFGGRTDLYQSNIIDIILPKGKSQTEILKSKSDIAKIPAISVKKEEKN